MTEPVLPDDAERPPLFKTWSALYAFVLSFLALLIAAFYLFGRFFS